VDKTTEEVSQYGSLDSAISAMIEPESVENEDNDTEIDDSEDENTEESNAETEEESDEDEASDDDSDDDAEDEEDDTDSAGKQDPVFTVKIDGTDKQVTLSELKRGYSGQQFVQKGMQEAAGQRKQAEEVYAALLNERQQIASCISRFKVDRLPHLRKHHQGNCLIPTR
jgi:hypothetical protein